MDATLAFVIAKNLVVFCSFLSILLLTGVEDAKAGATKYAKIITTQTNNNMLILTKMPKWVQYISVGLLSLVAVRDVSDILKAEYVREIVDENFIKVLAIWCFIPMFLSAVGFIKEVVERRIFKVFFVLAGEFIEKSISFFIACIRIQVQIALVVLPIYILVSIFKGNIIYYGLTELEIVIGVSLYIWLLYLSIKVSMYRFAAKLVWYDFGCVISSVAIVLLILNNTDNDWTPMFFSGTSVE